MTIDSEFIQNPIGLNFEIAQKENDSIFNLKINTGTLNDRRNGLVVESKLNSLRSSEDLFPMFEHILDGYHSRLSDFFKSLTKGELYDSFNR